MTVGDICTKSAVTVRPTDSAIEAARRMRDQHVGTLVVVDAQARPIGILTDRDVVVSAVAQSPDKLEALVVADIMTGDVATVGAGEGPKQALALMRTRGVRRLPVVSRDGRVKGLIALDDILRVMSEELRDLVTAIAQQQRQERELRV